MLYLLSYTEKELTNSLLLASDWLTISVCVIWFDKQRFIEKSHKMTSKIPLLLQILGYNVVKNEEAPTEIIVNMSKWNMEKNKIFIIL